MTLDRPYLARCLTIVHQPRKLPMVLSVEEEARLLEAAPGPKNKAALGTAMVRGPQQAARWRRHSPCHAMLVASLVMADRMDEARQAAKRMLEIEPDATAGGFVRAAWIRARPYGKVRSRFAQDGNAGLKRVHCHRIVSE